MGVRLRHSYSSLRSTEHDPPGYLYTLGEKDWTVDIIDRDYAGAIRQVLNIGSDGVVIKNEGGRGDINKAIVPTIATLTMYVEDSVMEDFIADLVLGDEERFYLVVTYKERVKFRGYLLLDQVVEDITEGPRLLTVKAADGLSRMKEIKYPIESWADTLPISWSGFDVFGYPTFREIVMRCMDECGISALYASDHPLYNIYINWWEDRMDDDSASKPSVFDQVRCQNKLFYNLNDKETDQWEITPQTKSRSFSCYKVLETILNIFHAKIFYDEGRYFIRHAWGSEETNREMEYHSYQTDGTYIGSEVMDRSEPIGYLRSDKIRMLKPSSVEYIAPHKYVEVNYQEISETPLNGHIWEGEDMEWHGVNYFIADETVSLNLEFEHIPNYLGEPSINMASPWVFYFQVRIGTYYLERYLTNGVLTLRWVEDDSAYIEYEPASTFNFFASSVTYLVDPAPIDGPMEIRLTLAVYISDVLGATAYNVVLDASEEIVSYVHPDFAGTIHRMKAGLITQNTDPENNNSTIYRSGEINGNSRSKSIDTLLGNDTDSLNSIGQIYTWDSATSAYVPNSNDQTIADWGGGLLIQQKLVESYARTHTLPKQILNMKLDDTAKLVTMNTVLTYDGNDYLPITMEYITALDRYSGQWVQIGKSEHTVTVGVIYTSLRNSEITSGLQGEYSVEQNAVVVTSGSGATSGVLLSSRTYTCSDTDALALLDHIIPDLTGYTQQSIDNSYILYVNGTRWRYVRTEEEVIKAGLFTLEATTSNWNIWRAISAEIILERWDRLVEETGSPL